MKEIILSDEKLASEDWKCLFLIMTTMFLVVSGFLLNIELAKPECVFDYCIDNICITMEK